MELVGKDNAWSKSEQCASAVLAPEAQLRRWGERQFMLGEAVHERWGLARR